MKFDTNAYRNQVQDQFSGADGWDNFSQEPAMNFSQGPAMNADGLMDHAHEATPDAPELNFTITNANTTTAGTVVMFGSNINLDPSVTNFGSSAGVTIIPDYGVGYGQILRDTSSSPFTIGQIRMQSALNAAQVTQGIQVISTNIYGSISADPINMVTAISEYQFNNTIARSTKAFDITPNVYFSFLILPATTLTLTVYIKRKVNVARQLTPGAAIAGGYLAPNTGIKPVMVDAAGGLKKLGA